MKAAKVLFISHDASRTGAPIVLLNFLKWFKANCDIPFQVLLKNSGPLESEFEAIAPVSIFNREATSWQKSPVLKRLGSKLRVDRLYLNRLKQQLLQDNIGLIYANTITNGEILEFLSDLNCPVITHVHELEYWIQHRTGLDSFERVKRYTHRYIAVSQAVSKNLINNHAISPEKIDVVYAFVPAPSIPTEDYQQTRKQVLSQLQIPESARIVCASGTTDWRKGADLLIHLAYIVNQQHSEPVYFLWIGGEKQGIHFAELQHDIKNAGLEEYVRFLGTQPNPLDYFTACDVFTLVSREDPYPLVCLEAAMLGKPILCFDRSGGMKEFVENDCGFVVPYLDLQIMADKVVALLTHPELCQALGARAQQKVKERHRLEVASSQILESIEQFL